MSTLSKVFAIASGTLVLALAGPDVGTAQVQTLVPPVVAGAQPVSADRIKVLGESLVGNLEGNDPARDVIVFLPSSYQREPSRRYPVVYALHGYSIGAEQWAREIQAPQTIEGAFALGSQEMIVVLPDSRTMHNGSMYSSSVTTGDFENYIAHDVVAFVDANYRTIPDRRSRGLVGHSMGGYGASRIGMKHADVFGSLYVMSPCCMAPRNPGQANPANEAAVAAATSPTQSAQLPGGLRSQMAAAAAWTPNPNNPPFFVDLPWKDGELQQSVIDRWTANAPLVFVHQYIGNLRRYNGIYLDVGDQDGLRTDTGRLSEILNSYGIEHEFVIYPGNHTSGMADRFQNHVLPFFSRNLCGTTGCP